MKSLILLIVVLISGITGLDAQTPIRKDSLSISKTVGFEQSISYHEVDIKFKSVIVDSRCPKDVMCMRAGEAKVLVSIYQNDQFIKDKVVTIDASGNVFEELNTLYSSEEFKIVAYGLNPYPRVVSKNPTTSEAYQLELLIQPL